MQILFKLGSKPHIPICKQNIYKYCSDSRQIPLICSLSYVLFQKSFRKLRQIYLTDHALYIVSRKKLKLRIPLQSITKLYAGILSGELFIVSSIKNLIIDCIQHRKKIIQQIQLISITCKIQYVNYTTLDFLIIKHLTLQSKQQMTIYDQNQKKIQLKYYTGEKINLKDIKQKWEINKGKNITKTMEEKSKQYTLRSVIMENKYWNMFKASKRIYNNRIHDNLNSGVVSINTNNNKNNKNKNNKSTNNILSKIKQTKSTKSKQSKHMSEQQRFKSVKNQVSQLAQHSSRAQQLYTIKIYPKQPLGMHPTLLPYILTQRQCLQSLMTCYTPYLLTSFFTPSNIFLITQYFNGYILQIFKFIKTSKLPNLLSQIIIAIGQLHEAGLVYNNVNKNGIMIKLDGYVFLYQMGKVIEKGKQIKDENVEIVMRAPEYVKGGKDKDKNEKQNYMNDQNNNNISSNNKKAQFGWDWFNLGRLIYQIIQMQPFYHFPTNSTRLQQQSTITTYLLNPTSNFPRPINPIRWDHDQHLINLTQRLLIKQHSQRIGYNNDYHQILHHEYFQSWLKKYPKSEIMKRTCPPVFKKVKESKVNLERENKNNNLNVNGNNYNSVVNNNIDKIINTQNNNTGNNNQQIKHSKKIKQGYLQDKYLDKDDWSQMDSYLKGYQYNKQFD